MEEQAASVVIRQRAAVVAVMPLVLASCRPNPNCHLFSLREGAADSRRLRRLTQWNGLTQADLSLVGPEAGNVANSLGVGLFRWESPLTSWEG